MKFIYAYTIKAQHVDDNGHDQWTLERMGTLEAEDELEAIGKATKRAKEAYPQYRHFYNWTVSIHPIPRSEVEYAAHHYYGMRHPVGEEPDTDPVAFEIYVYSNMDMELAEEIEDRLRSLFIGKGLEALIESPNLTGNSTTTDPRED